MSVEFYLQGGEFFLLWILNFTLQYFKKKLLILAWSLKNQKERSIQG